MNRRHFVAAATATVAAPAIGQAQEVLRSAKANLRLVTLSRGLVQPWSMAFLPDGRMLITERPGRVRVFANGKLEPAPLEGVPKVAATGQGGLLDVCLHPNFAQNRALYLSYSADGSGGNATTVASAELGDGGLRGLRVIFEALPRAPGGLHFGSRIVFDRAGLMYVSTGERYNFTSPETRRLDTEDCYPNEGYGGFDIDVTRVFRRAGESAVDHREVMHTHYIPSDTVICE